MNIVLIKMLKVITKIFQIIRCKCLRRLLKMIWRKGINWLLMILQVSEFYQLNFHFEKECCVQFQLTLITHNNI